MLICILWAPTSHPTRYEYSEDTGEDLEENMSLASSVVTVAGDSATELERKERKMSSVSDLHVFGLGEGLEEDKRE